MKHAVYDTTTGQIVAVFDEPITAALPAGCGKVKVDSLDPKATCLSVAMPAATADDEVLDCGAVGAVTEPDRLTLSTPVKIACGEKLTITVQSVDDAGDTTRLDTPYRLLVTWGPDTLLDERRGLVAGTDTVQITVPLKRPKRGGKEQPYSIYVVASADGRKGCRARVEVPENVAVVEVEP